MHVARSRCLAAITFVESLVQGKGECATSARNGKGLYSALLKIPRQDLRQIDPWPIYVNQFHHHDSACFLKKTPLSKILLSR